MLYGKYKQNIQRNIQEFLSYFLPVLIRIMKSNYKPIFMASKFLVFVFVFVRVFTCARDIHKRLFVYLRVYVRNQIE